MAIPQRNTGIWPSKHYSILYYFKCQLDRCQRNIIEFFLILVIYDYLDIFKIGSFKIRDCQHDDQTDDVKR